MDETLGTRLRRERERRQIALASIAENTKINSMLLEGLERDDVSRWPSGIFRKSYVRSYAEAVGLDPDPVVREFTERWPDPQQTLEPVPAAAETHRLRNVPSESELQPTALADGLRRRGAAAACDVMLTCLIALGLFAVSGHFWTPLGLSMLVYYCGGIMLLGNTPGVCLFASRK